MYVIAVQFFTYIDRSNLSFAAFQFKADVHLSNTAYGLGASIFFVGYTIFQVGMSFLDVHEPKIHSMLAQLTPQPVANTASISAPVLECNVAQ